MPPKANPKISVDKATLEKLVSSLVPLLSGAASTEGDKSGEGVDNTDLNGVLGHLLRAVTVLTEQIQSLRDGGVGPGGTGGGAVPDLEKRVRVNEDELDECRQRSLKGNLIVTSIANQERDKVSLIKTEEQLAQENLSLTDHILELVKTKYDITVPRSDVQACHRLPNKSVILRLWNRTEGSAWSRIVSGIKEGKNLGYNVFFNFHLTRRRSGLLYEMRQLKKKGDISKFYSDENGQLTVLVKKKEDGGSKQKVTYFVKGKNKNSAPITLNKKELLDLVKGGDLSWAEQMEQ